jgi:hypothetical protein
MGSDPAEIIRAWLKANIGESLFAKRKQAFKLNNKKWGE